MYHFVGSFLLGAFVFSTIVQGISPGGVTSAKPGSFSLHVGGSRPELSGLKGYREAYGSSGPLLDVRGDYFFGRDWLQFGLGFGVGLHQDRGRTFDAQSRETVDLNNVNADETRLTLIPIGANALVQVTPFAGEWVRLQAWVGREFMYLEESRKISGVEKIAFTSAWFEGNRVGAAIHFRIDTFEPRSRNSLEYMGFGKVFISPMYEKVYRPSKSWRGDTNSSFSRESYGLLFTFASLN